MDDLVDKLDRINTKLTQCILLFVGIDPNKTTLTSKDVAKLLGMTTASLSGHLARYAPRLPPAEWVATGNKGRPHREWPTEATVTALAALGWRRRHQPAPTTTKGREARLWSLVDGAGARVRITGRGHGLQAVRLEADYNGPMTPGERLTAAESFVAKQWGRDLFAEAPPNAPPGTYPLKPVGSAQ